MMLMCLQPATDEVIADTATGATAATGVEDNVDTVGIGDEISTLIPIWGDVSMAGILLNSMRRRPSLQGRICALCMRK